MLPDIGLVIPVPDYQSVVPFTVLWPVDGNDIANQFDTGCHCGGRPRPVSSLRGAVIVLMPPASMRVDGGSRDRANWCWDSNRMLAVGKWMSMMSLIYSAPSVVTGYGSAKLLV